MSCSTQPEDQQQPGEAKEATLMPAKTIDSLVCARCKEKKGVLVVVHTSYCRDCLAYHVRGRFARAVTAHLPSLFQSSKPKPKPSFLLASSGGSASAAMIDMFRTMMCQADSGPKGRHRWSRVVVGWVDFGEEEEEQRVKREEAMRSSAERHGFEFWRVGVDEAFDQHGELLDPLQDGQVVGSVGIRVQPGRVLHTSLQDSHAGPSSPYRALMAHLPPTSHRAIRAHIMHSLLTRMALSLGQPPSPHPPHAPYLLFGHTSTRIASLTISALASGRGYALPLLVAPSLEFRGVLVVRPLTALGKKELVWLARDWGLGAVDWDWESGAKGGAAGGRATSLEALTQDFVQTLNTTHPSTVSTIARTAHKLRFPGFIKPDGKALPEKAAREYWTTGRICPLCELPSDDAPLDWLARTSITSLPSPPSSASPSSPSSDPAAPPAPVSGPGAAPPLGPHLCYACLTSLVSPSALSARPPPSGSTAASTPVQPAAEEAVPLPAWTAGNLVSAVRRARGEEEGVRREGVKGWMKEEGWLLDDDDDDREDGKYP